MMPNGPMTLDEMGRILQRIEREMSIRLHQDVYRADEVRREEQKQANEGRFKRIEDNQTWAFRLLVANLLGLLGSILLNVLTK